MAVRGQLFKRALIGAMSVAMIVAASASSLAGPPSDPGPPENLRPGDVVRDHGASVIVGPRGTGVMAEALLGNGSTQLLSVKTDHAGKVTVGHWGSDGASDLGGSSGSPSECSDGTATVWNLRWVSAYPWYFNSGSTPTNLNVTNTETTLTNAADNIVSAHNLCTIADNVTATYTYSGRTSTGTNIDSTNGCGASDGTSVVSFGDLTSGKVGYACWWYNGSNEMTAADIKLNKVEHGWWLPDFGGSCSGEWSVEAVATHEFGHAYGLDHVAESTHGNLTMSSAINGTCQDTESDLGWGDINGLNVNY